VRYIYKGNPRILLKLIQLLLQYPCAALGQALPAARPEENLGLFISAPQWQPSAADHPKAGLPCAFQSPRALQETATPDLRFISFSDIFFRRSAKATFHKHSDGEKRVSLENGVTGRL
jgi:hypothetical protein